MARQRDLQLLIPLATLIPLGTAMALVPLRGHVSTDVIALFLALTVVAGGVLAGRAGGIAAALMAAVGFDFFFTQPYLSLKIADGNDVLTTLLLLLVGLAVGSSARWEGSRVPPPVSDSNALLRVLHVAGEGCAEDVELSVRAELLRLLDLQDCWFTRGTTTLTPIDDSGHLRLSETVRQAGDAVLPVEGVAVPVMWGDQLFGYIEAVPMAGRVTSARSRKVAVAMAQTLGLAFAAEPSAP
jgi:Domain of unknown function (DUF4118)